MSIVISEITLYAVRLPLVHGFETSSHRKERLDHVLVRAVSSDGIVGWGECASPSGPFYNGETLESCWHIIRNYLVPLLVGRPWSHPQDAARLMRKVTGNNFARAGIEMACWDLLGKQSGRSLAFLLGAATDEVEAGVSLGIEPTIDALLDEVASQVDNGYRRVKLKIRHGWDLEPVHEVRAAFPKLMVHVDANGAYQTDDIPHLLKLDDFGLSMIEQPFPADDLLAHADLARRAATPVCLDESITSVPALMTALHVHACSIVNIKVSRLGGIGAAKAVHDVCREHGVPVWCGGMHEFGVGRAANLALASLPGFTLPSDVSGSDKYYRTDIVTVPIRAVDGMVAVPTDPGIGLEVDEHLVVAHALRAWQSGNSHG